MKARPRHLVATAALGAGALLSVGAVALPPAGAAGADPSQVGAFAPAFEEAGPACTRSADQRAMCKPAGASVVLLPDGRLVYWDALEGMEDVRYNVVAEYGNVAQNDMARLLDLRGAQPVWRRSNPDPASNPHGNPDPGYLPVVPHNNDNTRNDGDLFCSDQVLLADGRVLDAGGTGYYLEPGVSGVPYGVSELKGLRLSRIYDSSTNRWSSSGKMAYGRWYPSLVTLPDNSVFVASGVDKLIKPVYPDRPPTDSGRNVPQTETYHPASGTWSYNGATADKSLPLFPRLHLLPDGHVYYDAAGQTFNPDGQAYDEALWNMASSYDPVHKSWTDLGLPEFDGALKGFRGSGFSQMLPLAPPYTKASFLSAGGVYGVSPGTYVATSSSVVNTVDTTGGTEVLTSKVTSPMNARRWYGSGVTLPTGQVLVFSGADRDEVVAPGGGTPVTAPEMFDPASGTWTTLAPQSHGRTYHNSALLLPDGRVLVGGHAPIGTGYAFQTNAGHDALGLSNAFRDPSFEIFSPPNLFYGPRPVISSVPAQVSRGRTITVATPDAASVAEVSIVRNAAVTHLVDGDQRVVVLPVVSRQAGSVTVSVPGAAAVLPDGPYHLFVSTRYAKGLTPSVGRQVFVGTVPPAFAQSVAREGSAQAAAELRARRAAGKRRAPSGRAAGAPAPAGQAAGPVGPTVAAVPADLSRTPTSLAVRLAAAVGLPRSSRGAAAGLALTLAGLGAAALLAGQRRRARRR